MRRTFLQICLLMGAGMLSATTCGQKQGQKDCEGVMCTMMFAAVTVQIQDAAGNPALLDSTLTLTAQGTSIHRNTTNTHGIYTVVDDSYQKVLAMRTEQVTFKGYRNGQMIVDQRFSVSADCCHVSKAEGPAVLTIP